jgi:predicted dehydrogenase
VPGQGLGYRDVFTIGLGRALAAIAQNAPAIDPSFRDGLAVARVVDAVQRSAAERAWTAVER